MHDVTCRLLSNPRQGKLCIALMIAFLSRRKSSEVLGGLRHDVREQLKPCRAAKYAVIGYGFKERRVSQYDGGIKSPLTQCKYMCIHTYIHRERERDRDRDRDIDREREREKMTNTNIVNKLKAGVESCVASPSPPRRPETEARALCDQRARRLSRCQRIHGGWRRCLPASEVCRHHEFPAGVCIQNGMQLQRNMT